MLFGFYLNGMITKLIMPSYMPVGKAPTEQLVNLFLLYYSEA